MTTTTTPSAMSQEEILSKIYRDFARLAGEIAIDRCRNRVLLKLVKEKLNVSDEELNTLFQAELQENLEGYCHQITHPMLEELNETTVTFNGFVEGGSACCGGSKSCG
jgi:endonuclease III-like uncharacterized protein